MPESDDSLRFFGRAAAFEARASVLILHLGVFFCGEVKLEPGDRIGSSPGDLTGVAGF